MSLRIDSYTGETYDADKYYRGADGLWHDIAAEAEWKERIMKSVEERRAKRNANRVSRGKRRKSPSAFNRSSSRYDRFLREDSGLSFREWLKWEGYR